MNSSVIVIRVIRSISVLSGLFVLIVLFSCGEKSLKGYSAGKTPLVELEDNVLYVEDLQKVLPLGGTDQDSAAFAERYIKNWIAEIMFYKNAVRNIPDTKDIDRLVENYRRSLITHEYQQRLIEQKIDREVSAEDIVKFYNDNLRLFVLNEPMIKGLFIKVQLSASGINRIRGLYMNTDDQSFEEIEKYCIKYAVRYEFFYDHWLSVSEIESLLPPLDTPLDEKLVDGKSDHLEFRDKDFLYLLNISDFITRGNYEPLEMAEGKIRDLLINNKEVTYMQQIKEDLYQSALDKDIIIFHNNKR